MTDWNHGEHGAHEEGVLGKLIQLAFQMFPRVPRVPCGFHFQHLGGKTGINTVAADDNLSLCRLCP